jgi:hypothetical protein
MTSPTPDGYGRRRITVTVLVTLGTWTVLASEHQAPLSRAILGSAAIALWLAAVIAAWCR